jgi:ABC-type lipoprotein release transport system permease subunit
MRLLAGELPDLGRFDPLAYVAVSGVLLVSGAMACFVPAQRAARIHPAVRLRND